MELKNKIINFLGDSITEGHGTTCQRAHFSAIIEREYGLARANEYGIGGTRIARQKNPSATPRHDLDYCMRCLEMDKNADINVIFGGTNDYGHGDAPIGTMADRTPDTFYGACHYLMSTVLTEYPGAVTVICTPLHRSGEENVPMGHPVGDRFPLSRYVEIIREVAEYYALPVLDLWSMSGMQPAVPVIRERYMPDGLHPNDAGHKLLAARIGGFLESL